MVDRLASLAEKDTAWREAKATVEAEIRRLVNERVAYFKVERNKEAYLARQEGYSIRKIAAALHTTALKTAYEAFAAHEELNPATFAPEPTEEFRIPTGAKFGQFVITPPLEDMRKFAAGLHGASDQTSALYYFDPNVERIFPVDPSAADDEGNPNPVLKYVMQTKGYLGRATDWAKENVGV